MKTKTLTVSFGWPNPQSADDAPADRLYRVEKVTDSVSLDPGQFLTRREIEAYTGNGSWKVTIVHCNAHH